MSAVAVGLLSLSLAQGAPTVSGEGAEPLSGLLQRLAEHDAHMEQYLQQHPITERVFMRELDGDGQVKAETKTVQVVRRSGGTRTTEVLDSTRNGAEALSAARAEAAERDKKNEPTESPFAARNQPKHRFTDLGPDPADPTLRRIAVEPHAEVGPKVMRGEASVDPERGEVVRQSLRPSKLPPFVDRFDLQLDYSTRRDGLRLLSRFSLAGEGGILFLRRQGSLVVNFQPP